MVTGEWSYYWMTGPIYGLQTGSHDWYNTVRKYLIEEMGFTEGVNAKSVYLHEEKRIRIAMHVDDPIIIFKKDAQGVKDREWFFQMIQRRFEVKETHQLKGEAETYALSEGVRTILYLKHVAEELGIAVPEVPALDCDANAALGFVHNQSQVGRMKHIDLRDAWIRTLLSNSS